MSVLFLGYTSISIIVAIFVFSLVFFLRKLSRLKKQVASLTSQLDKEIANEKTVLLELSELKKQYDQNISYDILTGLPNRQVFEDRLLQVVNQSKRYQLSFGVLFLDIDGFNVINNALGHEVGDELLKLISVRLLSALRQVDTVCRFSGDEFVLLVPQISKSEVCAYIAQRLLDSLSQSFQVRSHNLFITASIGIAVYPIDGEEGQLLLANADTALCQAKSLGSNHYQFYRQEMYSLSMRELALQSSLRDASIYKDFMIFYQPEVNTKTKEITCMEALLRWQHPDFGVVTPREFLRLAENSGKIIEIGEWVLHSVCQQFQKWKSSDFHLQKISVNISLRQLENPHFVYKLSQILHETGMEPKSLVLEIIDDVFHRLDLLEKSLHMLKQLGVQMAIDDFGTGHLSLSQLKRFSIDYLKIDSVLIQDSMSNPEGESIIKMIVSLAESLHSVAIAKGVETHEQKKLLEKLNCHLMQGHLFSIPRKPEEFTSSLEKAICEA